MQTRVPEARLRAANEAPLNPAGAYVLYWMIAARRAADNFGLQRAVETAAELRKPLLVLEALRSGYAHASDRFHSFVIDGMADNAESFRGKPVLYYPHLEIRPGHSKGLLEALAADACCVVTDDAPVFFLPRMVAAAAAKVRVRLEAVDSVGLLPFREARRDFPTAYAFRRHLHKRLPYHLTALPRRDPFEGADLPRLASAPEKVRSNWPAVDVEELSCDPSTLSAFPVDHGVPATLQGGPREALRLLKRFVKDGLSRYPSERNHPDLQATSGLSPYLHFGHVSAHRVFSEIARAFGWAPEMLADKPTGKRLGWWGMPEAAEEFLDQLVTWRELGHATAAALDGHDEFRNLPHWALGTLAAHSADRRERVYGFDEFESASTHDQVWNAAQRELLETGRMHNYMRMLWGKKILEWSSSPEEALKTMLLLNDRHALDGRDPNSVSGVFWCLGRYDRPFGPERPVFGKVRYMSSANTVRKLQAGEYLERWRGDGASRSSAAVEEP